MEISILCRTNYSFPKGSMLLRSVLIVIVTAQDKNEETIVRVGNGWSKQQVRNGSAMKTWLYIGMVIGVIQERVAPKITFPATDVERTMYECERD